MDERTSGEKVGLAIDSTRTALDEAGQKTVQAVDKAASAVAQTGRNAQDAAITAERAARIANAVAGVREVRNHVVARRG